MPKRNSSVVGYWLSNAAIRVFLGALHLLPYRTRILWGGKLFATLLAPFLGHRKRVAQNLDFALPDLDPEKRAWMIRRVPELVGRTFLELFSPQAFSEVARAAKVTGPGLAVLEAAREAGRPVILVSGHFGNYDVVRACLIARGFNIGALFRRMNNPYYHAQYIKTIEAIGQPLFERGKPGMAQMVRFLKGGGALAMLIDQYMNAGEPLKFFGHKALTATSAAKLALKYDAALVPFYAIRQQDGLHFELHLEAPIAPSDAATMTQALNDSLEARVRDHMDQWLWIHRRWKGNPAAPDSGR